MRTRVYDGIVELLSDGRWHWLAEIGHVTRYVDDWAKALEREPAFEVDSTKALVRLRSHDTNGRRADFNPYLETA